MILSSVAVGVLAALSAIASAQGPTTAAIGGRILDHDSVGLSGAEVVVTNQATGIAMRATSRAEGRYLVSGLDVGGPYSVSVRRIGSPMRTKSGLFVNLGQQLQVDIVLEQQPLTLEGMETEAEKGRGRVFSRAHTGAETLLSDSLIHQMPVINRDLYDLARLAPQTSTWFAITASGANPRVNSIQIDGIRDQVPASNLAAGALYGAKVMPLDAVKEYQLLFSPFDVRHGGFAGASVNVVTKSGTNDLHGSAFAFGTNEQLGPNVPFIRNARYDKEQFGLSLGGPIIRDRLLFFVASDVQRRFIPALGPYVDEEMSSGSMLPVKSADVARFQQLLYARGLSGGTAGALTNANPSSSVFLRLDAPVPRWNSRISVRGTYGYGDSSIFARPTTLAPTNCPTDACFPLSSLQHSRWIDKRSAAVQLISNLPREAYNELLVGFTGTVSGFRPTVKQPLILVTVPGTSGAAATLQSGTHEIATGQRNTNWSGEVTDNLSFAAGPHRFTAGVSTQFFDLRAFQLRGAYGVWEFASLDSLQSGTPSRYRVTRDTGSVTAAHGMYHSLYVGDEWNASSRLSLTFGLRSDIPILHARPPYVGLVDSIFHLRTDRVPSNRAQWSPRVGFNLDVTRTNGSSTQLRGGAGLFAGTPPLFWLFGGFSAYGLAARTLQCGSLSADVGPAPAFNPDYRNPPKTCGGGQSFAAATSGEVDVIDSGLRFPQVFRASLAVDRALPFGIVGTIEGLYTRTAQALFYTGVNLAEPVGLDGDGRLMYGTVASNGIASPRRVTPRLVDVVSIRNQSRDDAYDVTGELRKTGRFTDASASVSYGRARDVQSPRPTSALLIDDWRFARPVAGRQDDMSLTTSDYDQPLRVRGSGTIHSPWRRWRTDLSFYYVGGTGLPYTYVAGGAGGRGDLNADGAVGNDPIYIPRVATDTAEIRFSGTAEQVVAQQTAFDRFIDTAPCLRRQRGRIMDRNSCRTPWMNLTNLAVRQTVAERPHQAFALELQVFNVLNLLNPRWGRVQLPVGAIPASSNQVALLSQTGETTSAQPIYRFDTTMRRYSSENYDTYYQIQLALKYSF